jgi:hypothetical protein
MSVRRSMVSSGTMDVRRGDASLTPPPIYCAGVVEVSCIGAARLANDADERHPVTPDHERAHRLRLSLSRAVTAGPQEDRRGT